MSTIKNQIKSFVSGSLKDELKKYFVFLGGISSSSTSIDETDISIVSRITKDEVSIVVPRINWSHRNYTPYYINSLGDNTYCYNDVTDIVYLCVGKNQPSGLIEGDIQSTIEPSHTYGIQTYSDGYSWMALYRIDLQLSKFLTETVIPISKLEDFTTQNDTGTYYSKYSSICKGDPGLTGNCYFYYTERTKDAVGTTVYEIGDLVSGIGNENWQCSVCHDFGGILGYKTKHVRNNSNISEIERNPSSLISSKLGNLDPNDRFYIHYKNAEYQTNLNRGIVNLQLDIQNLSIEDRIVTTQNPVVTVLDALGIGATARLETYYDIPRNTFIANGITLLSSGSSYINPSFSVSNGNASLSRAIKAIVLPDISDPSVFLPNPKVSVIKTISKSQLDSTFETTQTIFPKVGIIKNVTDSSNTDLTINSTSNQPITGRTTSILQLTSYSPCVGCFAVNPTINLEDVFIEDAGFTGEGGKKIIIKTTDTSADSADYSAKIVAVSSGNTGSIVEISGADELGFDVISQAQIIEIDGTEYTISTVKNPDYKLSNIEYITKRVLDNKIVFDSSTGTESSAKLSFLI